MIDYFAVTDATWPAAGRRQVGPFLVREGAGGGNRVSAASRIARWGESDIAAVEDTQVLLGQSPLFMIRPGEDDLDAALEVRGYRIFEPVVVRAAEVAVVASPPPPLSAFAIWPPLEIMCDLWREGGIGPGRLAVMHRAEGPKTAILGRANDRAAGTAFVAIHGKTAMLHALHVDPGQRRQGTAVNIMRMAAIWAQDHGATQLSIVVTRANDAANALYAFLGMQIVGHYHYRSK
ncbi:MAG: GNAT family N-acetyltransferase [Rhodobacteraceae bacterium]|nr:GNAT family N-acetyltransferase [Paracoccaceae bacterium]